MAGIAIYAAWLTARGCAEGRPREYLGGNCVRYRIVMFSVACLADSIANPLHGVLLPEHLAREGTDGHGIESITAMPPDSTLRRIVPAVESYDQACAGWL